MPATRPIPIEIGDPVILKDASKLKKYGLVKNMKGMCNNLVTVPGQGDYIYFMPEGTKQSFVIERERCVLDEEAMNATPD